jgi:iron complex transport system ATP-binding protein
MGDTATHDIRPALEGRDITAGYGACDALRGVSIEVAPGELVAIVGPNGAGKSTLLRVLGGTLKARRGEVRLFGRALECYERRALARLVAVIAQESTVAFPFTVMEVVLMGRAPHLAPFRFESRHDLEIAHEALKYFDLQELAGRRLHELSGGERKRVFLARALAQEPKVLLLDEPTAFLDMKHVAEVFVRFRELCAERAVAAIATLHDLNAAAVYADRVLLMKDGQTVAYGSAESVLSEGNLSRVYETQVCVGRNPATGKIAIFPGRAS